MALIALNPVQGIPPGIPVQATPARTFEDGSKRYVNAVAVTDDGKRFLTGGFDNAVRAWDLPPVLPAVEGGAGLLVPAGPANPGGPGAPNGLGAQEGIRIPGGA